MGEEPHENISFLLEEEDPSGSAVTYEELLHEVDMLGMAADVSLDGLLAQKLDYQTNYLRKELDRMAEYYGVSKRKKRKPQLAEALVAFENDPENAEIVYRRKLLWEYMGEIKADKYLSKYLILD
jgi:hypothetical protein